MCVSRCKKIFDSRRNITNSANDGSPPVVLGGFVLGVQLSKPLNSSATSIQMVKSVGHDESIRLQVWISSH